MSATSLPPPKHRLDPLLSVDNLSLTFPPGDRESEPVRALCGVDLRVEAGDVIALFAMAKDVPEVERLLQVSIDFF